jgi:hypothetical protein
VFSAPPIVTASPPVAVGGGQPAQACFAQQFVCPLQVPTTSGSACGCPAGAAGMIPGVAQ